MLGAHQTKGARLGRRPLQKPDPQQFTELVDYWRPQPCYSALSWLRGGKGRRLARPALRLWRRSPALGGGTPQGTPLAGTQGRTRRCRPWAEAESRHERRRDGPQRFATQRTRIGAHRLRSHPIPFDFTLRIDTLNRGARHDGHAEFPQRPFLTWPVSPLKAGNSPDRPSELCDCYAAFLGSQWERTTRACGDVTNLWKRD